MAQAGAPAGSYSARVQLPGSRSYIFSDPKESFGLGWVGRSVIPGSTDPAEVCSEITEYHERVLWKLQYLFHPRN